MFAKFEMASSTGALSGVFLSDIDPGGSDDDPAFAAFVAADSDDEAAVPALSAVGTAARETHRSSPAAVLAPTGRRGRERPASARKRRDAPALAPTPAPGGKAAPSVPAAAVPEVGLHPFPNILLRDCESMCGPHRRCGAACPE